MLSLWAFQAAPHDVMTNKCDVRLFPWHSDEHLESCPEYIAQGVSGVWGMGCRVRGAGCRVWGGEFGV